MSGIDKKQLDVLRAAGLHVSHPIPAFSGGVWVCKPTTTPGNRLSNYSGGYVVTEPGVPLCPEIDAPMLRFYVQEGKWVVNGQDCAGAMGPADFIDEWSSADEAVKDILNFYFGDPARMVLKGTEHAKVAERVNAFQARNDSSSASA